MNVPALHQQESRGILHPTIFRYLYTVGLDRAVYFRHRMKKRMIPEGIILIFCLELLVEVALQQAFESLAMARLVASHLMHGVMDRVKVHLLGHLRQLELAVGRAVLGIHAQLEVLLGGVGHDLAQQLGELARHENRLFAALRAAKRLIFFASPGNDPTFTRFHFVEPANYGN